VKKGTAIAAGTFLGALALRELGYKKIGPNEGSQDLLPKEKATSLAKKYGVKRIVKSQFDMYDPNSKQLFLWEKDGKVRGLTLFHELGHATTRNYIAKKTHPLVSDLYDGLYLFSRVVHPFVAWGDKSYKSALAKRYLAFAPVLFDEALAHAIGYRLAKKHGMPYDVKDAATAYSTYLVEPAMFLAGQYLIEKLVQLGKRKRW